uniref:Uncharacterized protein n=1 Tax=Mycena chlorophos TaxID=658473 RepID=A0ABQ0LV40_MYCCL|nr:predicted protein [Mycena chlorophos]
MPPGKPRLWSRYSTTNQDTGRMGRRLPGLEGRFPLTNRAVAVSSRHWLSPPAHVLVEAPSNAVRRLPASGHCRAYRRQASRLRPLRRLRSTMGWTSMPFSSSMVYRRSWF